MKKINYALKQYENTHPILHELAKRNFKKNSFLGAKGYNEDRLSTLIGKLLKIESNLCPSLNQQKSIQNLVRKINNIKNRIK